MKQTSRSFWHVYSVITWDNFISLTAPSPSYPHEKAITEARNIDPWLRERCAGFLSTGYHHLLFLLLGFHSSSIN